MSAHNVLGQRRAATERLLERVARDSSFRRQLLAEPGAVLEAAGLGPTEASREVVGYWRCPRSCQTTCVNTCKRTTVP